MINNRNITLIEAATQGDSKTVETLLEQKADVNQQDEYKTTALIYAAKEGHALIVNQLLDAKADINHQGIYYDEPALSWAAKNGHTPIVERLLEAKADPNLRGYFPYFPALYDASFKGHSEIVKLLLKANANVNSGCGDKYGNQEDDRTAISIAALKGHTAIVEELLKAKADINNQGSDALPYAAYKGSTAIVELLLEAKAETRPKCRRGTGKNSPSREAEIAYHYELAEKLAIEEEYQEALEEYREQIQTFNFGLYKSKASETHDEKQTMSPLRMFASHPIYDHQNLKKEIASFLEPERPLESRFKSIYMLKSC